MYRSGASQRQWVSVQGQLVPKVKNPSTTISERRQQATIRAALQKGYLKILDQKLILDSQISEGDGVLPVSLEQVRKIDVRGLQVQALDELAILSCARLRICNLSGCFIKNISAFYGSVNLLKLDLSNNQISLLPPSNFWTSLVSLRVLYLHGNLVNARENVLQLQQCPQLHILTLYNTPLSLSNKYRHQVVNSIFSLRALDQHVVSDGEVIEHLYLTGSFRPLSENLKLPLYVTSKTGASVEEELCVTFRLLLAVDRVLARYSPVAIIQRWVRGWLVRRALLKNGNDKIRELVARKLSQPPTVPLQISLTAAISSSNAANAPPFLAELPIVSSPPPPPSTPYTLPMETRALGLDSNTKRMKCSLHIDLGRLQFNIEQSDSLTRNTSMAQELRIGQVSRRKDVWDTNREISTQPWSIVEGGRNSLFEGELEKRRETTDEEEMELLGRPLPLLTPEILPELISTKKQDVHKVKRDKEEIHRRMAELKQPPDSKHTPKSNSMSKDDFIFTRVYATMNLSVLRDVEKVHRAKRKNMELEDKANMVSRIKNERILRKKKIKDFQKNTRNKNREWREEEEMKLEERKNILYNKRQTYLLKKSQEHDLTFLSMQRQQTEQNFSHEFSQHHNMISNTLGKEDRKSQVKASSAACKERVNRVVNDSLQQQEETQRYLEMRRERVTDKAQYDKSQLNAKKLEAASQRLLESKLKVEKEVTRKEAARVAIALARDEMRMANYGPGEGRPALLKGPALQDDSMMSSHREFGTSSESKTPLMRMVPTSTWQRGAKVIKGNKQFPLIHRRIKSPLMYGMMTPYQITCHKE